MKAQRFGPRGFTLVELLVVIGIIALLISILLPALSKARRQAQLVQDLSNIRMVAIALVSYATENRQMLPAENPGVPRTVNRMADLSWTQLTTQYKIPPSAYGCNTMNNIPQYWSSFGLYMMNWKGANTSIIGWNYFGGRIPNQPAPATPYRQYLDPTTNTWTPFNVIHNFYDRNASSQVLLTCINYDAVDGGQNFENICPHYKGGALYQPAGTAWKPMDGLCCAFLDGHAVWVPYGKLIKFKNADLPSIAFIPPANFYQ
jgi:prepilin-type N-terminal cleavage/methylation domain-containing protein